MLERPGRGLGLRVDAVADRPALHENDRMVAVLAGDRGREPRTKRAFARRATCSKLWAER